MDVFDVRRKRLEELARVENALLHLEFSLPDVPPGVWLEHARLAVRRYQLAVEVPMDREAEAGERRPQGGVR